MISFYEWEAKMFSTGKEEKENKCDACIPFDSLKHLCFCHLLKFQREVRKWKPYLKNSESRLWHYLQNL